MYDLVVIGTGPGGDVGAIRAAQLGMKVAVVKNALPMAAPVSMLAVFPPRQCCTHRSFSKKRDMGFRTWASRCRRHKSA